MQTSNGNLTSLPNGVKSCIKITPHFSLFMVQVLQNIPIPNDLSNINSSHARKYIANKLVLMYLQTFVKIHLGYKA